MQALIVEDNELSSKLLSIILTKTGCSVDIASNGTDALKLFLKNNYEVIFMDSGLPDINGLTVTKVMRLYNANSRTSIHIIVLTAHAYDTDKTIGEKIGIDLFLSKPANNEQIQEVINSLNSGEEQIV